jgi:serine protease DegQ
MHQDDNMIQSFSRGRVQRLTALLGAAAFLIFSTNVTPLAQEGSTAQPPFSSSNSASGLPTLADLLERTVPAVVSIGVRSPAPIQTNPLYNDPFFRRYFGQQQQQRREQQPAYQMSAGSGVIVDAEEGHILTNYHVVANGQDISVTLSDGRTLTANLVGGDQATDIALLRIEADNLTELAIRDSDELRVGDYVVAIGNPFGLGQTVTSGIVSALGRSGLNIEGYEDFIQTDASINPGNSGGALITLDGQLVGINTAILAPSGGNVGIGFAVPTTIATAVMAQLIENGEVRRGQLGVTIQNVTPELSEALGLPGTTGALVSSVALGSAAEEAGIASGDVIIAVDGDPVDGTTDLRNRVGLTPLGEVLDVTLIRMGEERTVEVTIEEASAEAMGSRPMAW